MNKQQHWEQVYQTKPADTVSWFQAHAERSLALIKAVAASPDAAIIDVGGGASTLIDDLLTEGYRAPTVLDLSAQALSVAKQRLGQVGQSVRWLVSDICSVALPAQAYDIWHDRAVFHFLTQPEDRQAYVNQVMKAVKPGGHVIVQPLRPMARKSAVVCRCNATRRKVCMANLARPLNW
jgi:2-polyprenyl-3-methyl-5-hydroxy-6-metoxy-1,4-benzoquinol methylase